MRKIVFDLPCLLQIYSDSLKELKKLNVQKVKDV